MKQKIIEIVNIGGVAEAAKILKIQKKNFSHAKKAKGFPDPILVLECGPLYSIPELIEYTKIRDSKKLRRAGD